MNDLENDNRQYNQMDLRLLKSLRAPLDDPTFRKIYFSKQGLWARAYPTGAMPQAALLEIVDRAEAEIARQRKKQKVPA